MPFEDDVVIVDTAGPTGCRRNATALAMSLSCLLLLAPRLRGQTIVELAAGWTHVAQTRSSTTGTFGPGLAIRASVGRKVRPGVELRIDGMEVQFDRTRQVYHPCPAPGCTSSVDVVQRTTVEALTANTIVDLDARGVAHLIGGAGLYDSRVVNSEVHFGLDVGAGIRVPISTRAHVGLDGCWHWLANSTDSPTSLLPVTLGFGIGFQ